MDISPVRESTKRKELVCRCSAYSFPHRFTGGRCSGSAFVSFFWWHSCGNTEECNSCISKDTEMNICEIVDGREDAKHCDALINLKRYHR